MTYLSDGLLVGVNGRPGFPQLLDIGTTAFTSFFKQLDLLLNQLIQWVEAERTSLSRVISSSRDSDLSLSSAFSAESS
jgi:hypothetical protein